MTQGHLQRKKIDCLFSPILWAENKGASCSRVAAETKELLAVDKAAHYFTWKQNMMALEMRSFTVSFSVINITYANGVVR